MWRFPALLGLLLFMHVALAIPIGYRYIGSRVVSEGRHVYWYWNADVFQVDGLGTSFVAHMYARNLELKEERGFVAIIRCDTRSYRRADSKDAFDRIEEGDPVYEVWRAGCDGPRAASLATRNQRLNGAAAAKAAPTPTPATPSRANAEKVASVPASVAPGAKPAPAAAAPASSNVPAPAAGAAADERRVDSCIRFTERSISAFGDATITNTCKFAVEVAYCYKAGRGGAYDCPSPPRTKRLDSLGPGATHNLPEYKRGSNNGVALVACKGLIGTVTPLLNSSGGKTGCS
jgi:hypothetical protein